MTGQQRFSPAPLPAAIESPVLDALRAAHDAEPFLPTDPRQAAHRVVEVVAGLGVRARVLRGSLDLGGAELEHLFVALDDRVVDVALPVNDEAFVAVVRAFVAGDVGTGALVAAAEELDLASRVVGLFPARLGYRGAPLWGATA